MRDFTIGEAADASGVKVNTIRFYEERGLLTKPPRSEGNRRLYDAKALARLRFIRHARDLGFDLAAITELLDLAGHPEAPCVAADSIAQRQIVEIDRRIRHLTALRGELQRMVAACAGEDVAHCRVIESLADHSHCEAPHQPA